MRKIRIALASVLFVAACSTSSRTHVEPSPGASSPQKTEVSLESVCTFDKADAVLLKKLLRTERLGQKELDQIDSFVKLGKAIKLSSGTEVHRENDKKLTEVVVKSGLYAGKRCWIWDTFLQRVQR